MSQHTIEQCRVEAQHMISSMAAKGMPTADAITAALAVALFSGYRSEEQIAPLKKGVLGLIGLQQKALDRHANGGQDGAALDMATLKAVADVIGMLTARVDATSRRISALEKQLAKAHTPKRAEEAAVAESAAKRARRVKEIESYETARG